MGRRKARLQKSPTGDGYLSVDVSRLRVGTSLQAPIYDDRHDRNVLLLSAGTEITTSVLDKLRVRGIETIRIHPTELARMDAMKPRTETSPRNSTDAKDDPVRSEGSWGVSADSFLHQVERHPGRGYESQRIQQFRDKFQSSLTQTESLFTQLSSGNRVSGNTVLEVSREATLQIANDLDLFVSLGLAPNPDRYPMRHSLQSSMVAMSIGTTLGLSKEELTELGAGCLLHDLGMLRIDQEIYELDRVLDPIEFLEITKHPTYTFELIQDVNVLSTGSRMVAYQIHERCNGSGYPRKRKKEQIHYLARIAAVADAFVAMISPRPYRPAYLPYHALEEIIRGTRLHLFDPDVVRALLHTVSLFPIGSYVETTDGRVGTVVRANGEEYTRPLVELFAPCQSVKDHMRPVVEVYDPNHPEAAHEVVDLTQHPELSIKTPLTELPTRQVIPNTVAADVALAEDWE